MPVVQGLRPGFWGLCLRGDRRPCGSRSQPPTYRQAWGGALRSRCQAQRTRHWVQGSVTMATAGGGSRTPQNSEEHMGEGRTREGAPSRPPGGGGGLQHPVALLPLPPSFPSSPELSLLAFSPLSRSSATFPEPWLLRAEGDVYWPPSMHPAPSQVLYASELI